MRDAEQSVLGDANVFFWLLLKRTLSQMNDPRHKEIRIALVFLSGFQRAAALTSGYYCGLERHGLTHTADYVIAISAGGVAAFPIAGQIDDGIRILLEECPHKLSNMRRILRGECPFDMVFLERAFRGRLDQDAIRRAPSHLFFVVTDSRGQGRFRDARTEPDIVQAMLDSMTVPLLMRRTAPAGEQDFYDGAIALPCPTREVIEGVAPGMQPPNVIIIFANGPIHEQNLPGRWLAAQIIARIGCPKEMRPAWKGRTEQYIRGVSEIMALSSQPGNGISLEYLNERPQIAIVGIEPGFRPIEYAPQKLKGAIQQAEKQIDGLLMEASRRLPLLTDNL